MENTRRHFLPWHLKLNTRLWNIGKHNHNRTTSILIRVSWWNAQWLSGFYVSPKLGYTKWLIYRWVTKLTHGFLSLDSIYSLSVCEIICVPFQILKLLYGHNVTILTHFTLISHLSLWVWGEGTRAILSVNAHCEKQKLILRHKKDIKHQVSSTTAF